MKDRRGCLLAECTSLVGIIVVRRSSCNAGRWIVQSIHRIDNHPTLFAVTNKLPLTVKPTPFLPTLNDEAGRISKPEYDEYRDWYRENGPSQHSVCTLGDSVLQSILRNPVLVLLDGPKVFRWFTLVGREKTKWIHHLARRTKRITWA